MKTLLMAGGLILAMAGTGSAATVTLAGRIRDFNDTHPNFEHGTGSVTGAVKNQLGADGNPVWNNPSSPAFTTEADFNQWYNDVPDVNMGKDFQLTLNDAGNPGTYSYANSDFFPIDNQLLGNQGRSHNYHFTLELAGLFSFAEGQSFSFTGDDDLWVFFGGKLGIDLGGVHFSELQTIDSAGLEALGLTAGTVYDLNIFFAERHTTLSNFAIQTSFAVQPPDPSPVPLPAGFPLLIVAMGSFGLMRRYRR